MIARTRLCFSFILLFSIFIAYTNAGICCLYRGCTVSDDTSCASLLGRYYSNVHNCADTDNDGWADACDNCPNLYNHDQLPDHDCDGFVDASVNRCDDSCMGYYESPKNEFIKSTFSVPDCTTKQTVFSLSLLGEQKTAVNDFLGQNIATKTGFPSYIEVKRVGLNAGHKFSYYTGIGGGIDQTGFPGTVAPADGGGCTILYDDNTGFVDYSDMQLSPSVYKYSTNLVVAAGGGGLGAAFPTSNASAGAAGSMVGFDGECGVDGDIISCSKPTGGNSLMRTAGIAAVSENTGYTYQGADAAFLKGGNVMKADIFDNVLGFTGAGGCGYYGGGGASSHTTGKFHAGAGGSSYVGTDYWTSLVQTVLDAGIRDQNVLLTISWNTTCRPVDNCPHDYNPDQTDTNGNGKGDACDQCPLSLSEYGPDNPCRHIISPPPPPSSDTCCLRIGDDACAIYGGSFTTPDYCYLPTLAQAVCIDAGGSVSTHEDCSCTQGDDPNEYICNEIDDDCDGNIDENYDFAIFNCSIQINDPLKNVDLPCSFLLVETCNMGYHLNKSLLIEDLCIKHLQTNEIMQEECGVAHIFTRILQKDENKWNLGFMKVEPRSVGIGVALLLLFIIIIVVIALIVFYMRKSRNENNTYIKQLPADEEDREKGLIVQRKSKNNNENYHGNNVTSDKSNSYEESIATDSLSDKPADILTCDYESESSSGVDMKTLGPEENPNWQKGFPYDEDNHNQQMDELHKPALFTEQQLRAQAAPATYSHRFTDKSCQSQDSVNSAISAADKRISFTYIDPPNSLGSFNGEIIDPNDISAY